MDDQRRKELYAQLRMILMELLWGRPQIEKVKEVTDDSVLSIHVREMVGTRERMM